MAGHLALHSMAVALATGATTEEAVAAGHDALDVVTVVGGSAPMQD